MAEASEELNFVIRMLFPDAKVPALDTKEAEASIAKLRGMWNELKRDMGGSMGGPSIGVPSGGSSSSPFPASAAPTGYPAGSASSGGGNSSMPAGYPAPSGGWHGLGIFNKGKMAMTWQGPLNANAPEPPSVWNGYRTGWSGPTPESYPYPALPGGRDARNALIQRNQYGYAAGPGFASGGSGVRWANNAPGVGNWSLSSGQWHQGPISDPGSYARSSLTTARGYDVAALREQITGLNFGGIEQGTDRAARGMTKAREAAVGLTAALVLLNKSQEQGSGWDNWYTQGTAGLGIATYGLRLASGAADMFRSGADIGSGALAAYSAYQGVGRVGRLAASGSRALAGLAGVSTATIAAPLAVAGGFGIAYAGAVYENWQATARGRELDLANQSVNDQRRSFALMAPANNAAFAATNIATSATADYRRAMSGEFSSFSLEAENARRLRAIGANAGIARGNFENYTGPGDEQARVHAGEQLVNILRQEQQILSQNVQKRQQEYQIQVQQVRVSQQQVDAARQLASQAGRVSNSDWRRGVAIARRAQRNGLNERDAEALDDLPGFGGAVDKFFSDRGQQRIDAIPKEFRDEKAKGSAEIAALEAKIKQFEGTQSSAVKALQDFVALNAGAWGVIEAEINAVKRELSDVITRNPTAFRGR